MSAPAVWRRPVAFFAVAGLAFLLASCAPQAASLSETGDNAAEMGSVAFSWSEESDCGMCHQTESASFEDSSLQASFHDQSDCLGCHDDASALSQVHEGASSDQKMPKKLKETSVTSEACQASGCHALSADELADKTKDSTALTDSNGKVVNPHLASEMTPSHVAEGWSCSDCHGMHKEQNAERLCASCHHSGVYECKTCHE